jgi:phosphatidylserine/phosphatidylglycerophosphate/cardiolipin synthase-like enzyme
MASAFQVKGRNKAAAFTLKIHRGEGMALLAMNWKVGRPPDDFVGFAIEYREPGSERWLVSRNRLSFADAPNPKGLRSFPSTVSPIQKFRWVVFPFNADLPGDFTFRVTPVFMGQDGRLANGEPQTAAIALASETYPGKLNVTFTRGYIASQAFVDTYESAGPISTLLPKSSKQGLTFVPTHPLADKAYAWMGFEARREILELLDEAVGDETAKVWVVAYDLSQADVVDRLEKLGARLRIIIDDSAEHAEHDSGETQAATRLAASGAEVKRQHMKNLQHNKTIVVDGKVKRAVCGSTNFTWRGLFVQSNNAIILTGEKAIAPFKAAAEDYWSNAAGFGATASAGWQPLELDGIDASVTFSPHDAANATLADVAADVGRAQSSLFYSLAFLHQTRGDIRTEVEKVTNSDVFVYGISDKETAIELTSPSGNRRPVFFARLTKNVPPPFKHEPSSGMGTNMHHKFAVIDFDKPSARVYTGSYNFSRPADRSNGENLLLIRDRRIATSYMVEALRIFDHYQFRVAQEDADKAKKRLELKRPPSAPGETPWWLDDYTVPHRIRDRELFA